MSDAAKSALSDANFLDFVSDLKDSNVKKEKETSKISAETAREVAALVPQATSLPEIKKHLVPTKKGAEQEEEDEEDDDEEEEDEEEEEENNNAADPKPTPQMWFERTIVDAVDLKAMTKAQERKDAYSEWLKLDEGNRKQAAQGAKGMREEWLRRNPAQGEAMQQKAKARSDKTRVTRLTNTGVKNFLQVAALCVKTYASPAQVPDLTREAVEWVSVAARPAFKKIPGAVEFLGAKAAPPPAVPAAAAPKPKPSQSNGQRSVPEWAGKGGPLKALPLKFTPSSVLAKKKEKATLVVAEASSGEEEEEEEEEEVQEVGPPKKRKLSKDERELREKDETESLKEEEVSSEEEEANSEDRAFLAEDGEDDGDSDSDSTMSSDSSEDGGGDSDSSSSEEEEDPRETAKATIKKYLKLKENKPKKAKKMKKAYLKAKALLEKKKKEAKAELKGIKRDQKKRFKHLSP